MMAARGRTTRTDVPGERAALVDRYARGPSLLRAAFAAAPEAARSFRSAPGRWSPRQVVCHCADAEMIAAVRIRFVLAEDHPVLVGYDQDRWAERLPYEDFPPEVALAVVDSVCAHTAALLRRLPEEAWEREAAHSESGRTTADDWLRAQAGHLAGHAGQIERAHAAWRAWRERSSA
jgi:hypothetical protein